MKFSKRSFFVCVGVVMILVFSTVGMASASREPDLKQRGFAVKAGQVAPADQVLVKFQDGLRPATARRIKEAAGLGKTIKKIGPKNHRDVFVYEVKNGKSAAQAVKELNRDPNVAVAEINHQRKGFFLPNDPLFDDQWGLENQLGLENPFYPGNDIGAMNAWDIEQGYSSTVTVAVIDSGIDLTHPDLISKIWQNQDEIAGNAIDDDNNGYIDDARGYNFGGISMKAYNWVQPLGSMDFQIAQSIKGTGDILDSIGVALLKHGEPGYGAVISVRDSLNGPNLASATILPADVEAAPDGLDADSPVDAQMTFVEKTLSASVRLADDQTYYITLETTSTNVANYYLVADLASTAGNDLYKDGMEHWKVGDTWLNMPNYDLTFLTNANSVPRDDNGHGTHVSGIIGAQTDNAIGVAGVSPAARIMPIRACGAEGYFWESDIIEAMHYAVDNGAKVINMSLGGPSYGILEQLAVYYATGKGVTVVAAAGDDFASTINYPAGYDQVVGVGALKSWWDPSEDTTYSGLKPMGYWPNFSNFNDKVDFAAPGDDILSTMPTYPVGSGVLDYGYKSGTSMAAPFVSGAASLIIARQPDANSVQVEKVLERGADDLGWWISIEDNWHCFGFDPWFGRGRINIYQSLARLMLNTRLLPAPTQPDGDNGWYTTTPTIALQIDTTSAVSYYAWGAGGATTYTVPFSPPAEGSNLLVYFSTFNGTPEDTQTKMFKLDTGIPTDPTTVVSGSHTTGTVSSNRNVEISIGGADDAVSGVEGYSVSWSRDNTATPAATMTDPGTETDFTSPLLGDGQWWFNLRTKDRAGNWTSTVHLGPFVIDGAPTTSRAIDPSVPNGDNSWYKTVPPVTLTPDEAAAVYYQLDSTSSGGWIGDPVPDVFVTVPVPDGEHILYYFSADLASNTETVQNAPFMKVDTVVPTGAISIDSGAAKTTEAQVNLALSATDAGSGPAQMRFKNGSGDWSVWQAYAPAAPWTLSGGDGDKTVYVQFKDAAGNVSAAVSDGITLKTDDVAPAATMVSPLISTNVSKNKTFPVSWSAADPLPTSGIAAYDVQYKIGSSGSWTAWKTGVTGTSATFAGLPGKTYYFRARAKDNSANTGAWSTTAKTIVPHDQNSLISLRVGFTYTLSKAGSNFFLGTIRYSTRGGDSITYKVNGKSATLIATKGPNRSKAEISVDGKVVKTIDSFASAIQYRKKVFSVSWPSSGKHTIKITNKGTPGRTLFDIDAVAVEN